MAECRTDFFVQSPILSVVTTQWCFIVARLLGRMSAGADSWRRCGACRATSGTIGDARFISRSNIKYKSSTLALRFISDFGDDNVRYTGYPSDVFHTFFKHAVSFLRYGFYTVEYKVYADRAICDSYVCSHCERLYLTPNRADPYHASRR